MSESRVQTLLNSRRPSATTTALLQCLLTFVTLYTKEMFLPYRLIICARIRVKTKIEKTASNQEISGFKTYPLRMKYSSVVSFLEEALNFLLFQLI